MKDDGVTASEMIEALSHIPPDTVLLTEGGFVGVSRPSPDDVQTTTDGTRWVVIN